MDADPGASLDGRKSGEGTSATVGGRRATSRSAADGNAAVESAVGCAAHGSAAHRSEAASLSVIPSDSNNNTTKKEGGATKNVGGKGGDFRGGGDGENPVGRSGRGREGNGPAKARNVSRGSDQAFGGGDDGSGDFSGGDDGAYGGGDDFGGSRGEKRRSVSPVRIFFHASTQTRMDWEQNLFRLHSLYCDHISACEKSTQVTTEIKERKEKGTTTIFPKSIPLSLSTTFSSSQFKVFCGVRPELAQFLSFRVGATLKDGKLIRREEKITLLLVKFKLHLPFAAVGGFFGLSERTARRVFYESLDAVYKEVKDFIVWFDKETIRARMPKAFKALYPETRVIIDCSEIECEMPSSLRQKVLMWSNYKQRYTVKFLVGIAPSGEVTFVSRGYGGRTTDTEITIDSGFPELLEEGDIVLSDKGFPKIEHEVNKAGSVLIMPPMRRRGGQQFSRKENEEGYKCASVRIHVERCIQRLKVFKILKFMPNSLLEHFNKILVTVCFVTNCMSDLISEEKGEEEEEENLS